MDTPEQKRKFLILIGLLVVALLAIGIWFLFSSQNSDTLVSEDGTSDSSGTGGTGGSRSSGQSSFSQLQNGSSVDLGFQGATQDSRSTNIDFSSDASSVGNTSSGQSGAVNNTGAQSNITRSSTELTYEELLKQYNSLDASTIDYGAPKYNQSAYSTTPDPNGFITVTDANPNVSTVDFGSGVILPAGQTGFNSNNVTNNNSSNNSDPLGLSTVPNIVSSTNRDLDTCISNALEGPGYQAAVSNCVLSNQNNINTLFNVNPSLELTSSSSANQILNSATSDCISQVYRTYFASIRPNASPSRNIQDGITQCTDDAQATLTAVATARGVREVNILRAQTGALASGVDACIANILGANANPNTQNYDLVVSQCTTQVNSSGTYVPATPPKKYLSECFEVRKKQMSSIRAIKTCVEDGYVY